MHQFKYPEVKTDPQVKLNTESKQTKSILECIKSILKVFFVCKKKKV